ncbi:YbaB/EbfC family nucleoid-associated protein [Nocardia sp. NPDC050710]|uniref:YbaB/EbfC family nucleoid-associated protein n=1 Tax=Nocardia sp. NPDC050710 TaxID=3157220 RepID=UPI0033F9A797
MANEHARAEMASVLDGVQQQLRAIARVQQERTLLTASATVRRRVTVTVNADGTVIETKFGPDIEDLGYAEIARAVTEAAQQAAAEVARKGQELMSPLHERRARLPKLSDLIEGMPDLTAAMPTPPPVSTAAPGSAERQELTAAAADGSGPMAFSDVETLSPEHADGRGVTDSSW